MRFKRAAEWVWWQIASIVALLIFLVVYLGFWSTSFGKTTSGFREQIASAGDWDNDDVLNRIDMCPCLKEEKGGVENEGCPLGYKNTGTGTGKEDRSCLTMKT